MLSSFIQVEFKHVLQEANGMADSMVKLGGGSFGSFCFFFVVIFLSCINIIPFWVNLFWLVFCFCILFALI